MEKDVSNRNKIRLAEPSAALITHLKNLSWIEPGFFLTPVKGGTINANFKMQFGEKQFLVKNFVGEEFVLLTRNDSFALQQKLADLELAPEPVYISNDGLIYIEKWCNIETLDSQLFDPDIHLPKLAQSLNQVHQIQVEVDELPLLAQWQRYLNRIETDQPVWQQRINNTAHIWMQAGRDCFCHHDLAFEHICLKPEGVLLDWEYAARSNRYFDIANAALANALTSQQIKSLCGCYANLAQLSKASVYQQVITMLPVAQLTSDLWYAASREENA